MMIHLRKGYSIYEMHVRNSHFSSVQTILKNNLRGQSGYFIRSWILKNNQNITKYLEPPSLHTQHYTVPVLVITVNLSKLQYFTLCRLIQTVTMVTK